MYLHKYAPVGLVIHLRDGAELMGYDGTKDELCVAFSLM